MATTFSQAVFLSAIQSFHSNQLIEPSAQLLGKLTLSSKFLWKSSLLNSVTLLGFISLRQVSLCKIADTFKDVEQQWLEDVAD